MDLRRYVKLPVIGIFDNGNPPREKGILTHLSLASHKGTVANNVDPDQTPQNAASDQGLHCLH